MNGETVVMIRRCVCKIKYELAVFSVLLAQTAAGINWQHPVNTRFLTFYLLDYKAGFVSGAFIGFIVSLFTGKVTEKWLDGFILLSFLVIYLLLALLFGKLMRSAGPEMKTIIIFLSALFLLTNYSVRVFTEYIGLLDIYLFLFALLALVCLQNRIAKWFVPLLCFMGLSTHISFVLVFLPVIFVLVLYRAVSHEQKTGNIILAAVSFFTAAGASVYYVFFANNYLKTDSGGLFEYLSAKADFPVWRQYYEGHLFYADTAEGMNYSGIWGFIEELKTMALERITAFDYIAVFLMMLPLIFLFFFIWKNAFKFASGKAEKAVFLLMTALPVPVLPTFVFSSDMERFLGEIIIVQFLALFFMIFEKNAAVLSSLKSAEKFFRKYPAVLILITVFSLSAFFFK